MLEEKIKLLIVDDHVIISDGLVKLLQDEEYIEIVKVCNRAKTVIDYLENNKVDVIVSDISMPEMNGLEMTEVVTKKYDTKIILLSMHEDEFNILSAIDKGASGYATKDIKKSELVLAIKKVAKGEKYYSSNILGTLVTAHAKRAREPKESNEKKSQLTVRELKVLELIASGLSNKEIGIELNISKRTVDTHRSHIMRKLDAKNTAMIVRIGIEKKLL